MPILRVKSVKKTPIFRVKSVQIYTGQKKLTRPPPVAPVTNMRYKPAKNCPVNVLMKTKDLFKQITCACFLITESTNCRNAKCKMQNRKCKSCLVSIIQVHNPAPCTLASPPSGRKLAVRSKSTAVIIPHRRPTQLTPCSLLSTS